MGIKMSDLGGVDVVNGVATKVDTTNVTTPTKAELTAVLTDAVDAGLARLYFQDDAGAGTTCKAVFKYGTDFFFVALTKAS